MEEIKKEEYLPLEIEIIEFDVKDIISEASPSRDTEMPELGGSTTNP